MSIDHNGQRSYTVGCPDMRVNAIVEWSGHAKDRWQDRGDDRGYVRAFDESVEVDYPSAHSACRGRYHAEADAVLIVKRVRRLEATIGWDFVDVVLTVIDLTDREPDEQQYVRQQVGQ